MELASDTLKQKIRQFFPTTKEISLPRPSHKNYLNIIGSLLEEQLLEERNIYRQLQQISTLTELPNFILKQPKLKIFQSCQLLLHKKGSQAVKSFISHQQQLTTKELSVSLFNKIAITIKKSKHKKFDQSNLDLAGLEILGPFLAQLIDFERYNIIIIISHNGFLPPSPHEENFFYYLLQLIKNNLHALAIKYEQQQIKQIITSLNKHFPLNFKTINRPLNITSTSTETAIYNLQHDLLYKIEDCGENTSPQYHLERVNLLGELLNTLKHELMNPLFGLNLGIQMLKMNSHSDDIKLFLDEMELSVDRSQKILENFSTLYSSKEEKEEIDINNLLNEVIILTKSETKQIPKNIITPNDLTIYSNKTALSQIIFNLLINAAQAIKMKFSNFNEGKIEITITSQNNDLILTICDNGIGISEEQKEKIFSPFFTTKEDGTGLGLTICQNLARNLNGSIYLTQQSKTCFNLLLKEAIYENSNC